MNAALQNIRLSAGERNDTHAQSQQQQRQIAAFNPESHGSIGKHSND